MKPHFIISPIWLSVLVQVAHGLEPVTTTLGVGAGIFTAISLVAYRFRCHFTECCGDAWLKKDFSDEQTLRRVISSRVYGQHIANKFVVDSIIHHMETKPYKALVMSFHGGTGVGKNYMTRIIAELMFKRGLDSNFVHLIVSTLHFPLPEKATEYRAQLQSWIQGNLTLCPRNLFIFDEIDKMPAGVLDAISPFINYYGTKVNGVDPREAIFVFLTNTGKRHIDETVYRAWESGRARESLSLADFAKSLLSSAYNEEPGKGLHAADMINSELIDSYVPFLPLERKHVEGCIADQLKENNFTVNPEIVHMIADEIDYFPTDDKLFSVTGCKRIREQIIKKSHKLRREPKPAEDL